MTIGIIGPELSGRQIQEHLRAISPETNTILYPRETTAGALEVIDQCEAECTAVLFTGVAVCASVIQHHDMVRAYEYVAKDAYSLMSTLQEMEQQGLALDDFSIDAVEPSGASPLSTSAISPLTPLRSRTIFSGTRTCGTGARSRPFSPASCGSITISGKRDTRYFISPAPGSPLGTPLIA